MPVVNGGDILKLAADLADAAFKRGGAQRGDVIIFLPGMHEIIKVQTLLKELNSSICICVLHSDTIDDPYEKKWISQKLPMA